MTTREKAEAIETLHRIATEKLLDDYSDTDSNLHALAYEVGRLAEAIIALVKEETPCKK